MRKYAQELYDIIEYRKTKNISSFCSNNKDIIDILNNQTSFLNYSASTSDRLYYVQYNLFEQVKCPICNNNTKLSYKNKKYSISACSVKCRNKVIGKDGLTFIQRNANKIKKTMSKIDENTGLSKYQISRKLQYSTLNIIDENGNTGYENIGLKTRKKLQQLINGSNKSFLDIKNEKMKNTLSKTDERTGLTGYEQIAIKSKFTQKSKSYIKKKNYINSLNMECETTLDEYINSTDYIFKYKCNKCETIRSSNFPYIRCLTCNPYNRSIGENEVLEYCKQLTFNTKSNYKSLIWPYDIDIYLPDHKLAIEYNGLFWHSSYSVDSESKEYHIHKTEECEKLGIQLFHIFENEWLDPQKQKIWKSIIRNKLGKSERIYARKCEIRSVSSANKIEFLECNHLQGNCMSSVNLGLYLEGELVSIMTFGKSRYDKKIDWELLRYCNKLNTSVVGGASKLLKKFRSDNLGSIISYADKRRSNGNLYKQLGFEFSHESGPNYWYYKDQGLESRVKYQKHKLKDQLKIFDSDLTESENMYNNKFRKIYDCGNQVWKLN